MSVWIAPEARGAPLPPLKAMQDAAGRAAARLAYRLRLPLALTGGLLAALSVLLALSPASAPPDMAGQDLDASAGVWTRDPDARPLLSAVSPALSDLPRSMGVWTRTLGGMTETEHRLSVGDIDRSEPYVLIIANRQAGARPPRSLFLASARHAADAGLAVGRFTPLSGERSSPLETARISLARAVGFGPVRNECLAWRIEPRGDIGVEGIACLPAERPEPDRIACLLRGLAREAGSAEPALRRDLLDAAGSVACDAAVTGAKAAPARVARTRQ